MMFNRKKAVTIWNQAVNPLFGKRILSTGLLIASSAVLGGIAVAIWNRQSLQKIRAVDPDTFPHHEPAQPDSQSFE